jgi:hypothetical protein
MLGEAPNVGLRRASVSADNPEPRTGAPNPTYEH